MRVFSRFLMVAAIVALTSTVAMAQADFYVTMTDNPDPVAAGGTILYTVEVGNVGDGDTTATTTINTDIYLPAGVPASLEAYLDGDADAVAAYDAMFESVLIDEAIFDEATSGFYAGEDFYCEGFLLQPQGLVLPAGASGSFSYEVVAPTETTRRGYLGISAPNLDEEILDYGRGGCSDSAEDCTGIPCMGPRLAAMEAVTAPIELADDGTGNSMGCTPLVGFTPGNIALVDRGTCAFEMKAVMATNAGAAGVIIGDSGDFSDSTVDPYDIINMACTDFCSQQVITIPTVLISWAHVDALKSDMTGATATMGAVDTEGMLYTDAQIWESGSAVDVNESNDTWTEETVVGGTIVDPPVAGFTYAPMEPTTDDAIQFTDTSTGEGIMAWAWDFGGVATSSEQNPIYTFDTAGTYTVTLTVTGDGGSDTATADILVTEGGGEPVLDQLYFIPAAAKAEGSAGAFFLTDMVINNAGAEMATYQFLWLPRNTDNAVPTMSAMFTLDAGVSVVYTDVLGSAFNVAAEDNAVGALAVASDGAMLKLMSRTYNTTDDGTFGQGMPGYHVDNLIQANDRQRIVFFVENDEYRSNLGLLNGTDEPLRIFWERFTADGTSVEEGFTDLHAWGNTQINQVFDDEAPVNGGYVDVWVASGSFAAYGSLLDNMTSDPTTVLPQ